MKKASDMLSAMFETFGIRDDKNYTGFINAWSQLCGERLAGHVRPMDIKNGTLVVAVDHPGWMTHVRMGELSILERVRSRFPQLGIESIAFQLVDELPRPRTKSELAEERAAGGGRRYAPPPERTDPVPPSSDPHDNPVSADDFHAALDRLRKAVGANGAGKSGG